MAVHRYITAAEFHRLRGLDLDPPDWRPPRLRFSRRRWAAEDPDPGYTDWIVKVAEYLDQLDQETRKQLKRLDQPVRLMQQWPVAAERSWFRSERLLKILQARGQTTDRLDEIVNDLVANLAISNEYADAVVNTADRARSDIALVALEQVLDLTHEEL